MWTHINESTAWSWEYLTILTEIIDFFIWKYHNRRKTRLEITWFWNFFFCGLCYYILSFFEYTVNATQNRVKYWSLLAMKCCETLKVLKRITKHARIKDKGLYCTPELFENWWHCSIGMQIHEPAQPLNHTRSTFSWMVNWSSHNRWNR